MLRNCSSGCYIYFKQYRFNFLAYGLFDKEEFLNKYHGWSSEEFDDYNLEYLSIAIGKGFLTIEELEEINEECIAYKESLLLK